MDKIGGIYVQPSGKPIHLTKALCAAATEHLWSIDDIADVTAMNPNFIESLLSHDVFLESVKVVDAEDRFSAEALAYVTLEHEIFRRTGKDGDLTERQGARARGLIAPYVARLWRDLFAVAETGAVVPPIVRTAVSKTAFEFLRDALGLWAENGPAMFRHRRTVTAAP
jgi:hypothetical protein